MEFAQGLGVTEWGGFAPRQSLFRALPLLHPAVPPLRWSSSPWEEQHTNVMQSAHAVCLYVWGTGQIFTPLSPAFPTQVGCTDWKGICYWAKRGKLCTISLIPAVLGCTETNSASPLSRRSHFCWHSEDKDKGSIMTPGYHALDSHQLSLPPHIIHFFQLNHKKKQDVQSHKQHHLLLRNIPALLLYNLLKLLYISFFCCCFLLFSASLTPPLPSFCQGLCSAWACVHMSSKAQLWQHSQQRRKQALWHN